MFLFSKPKLNDADSHILNINTKEGGGCENKAQVDFIGKKVCSRESVQEDCFGAVSVGHEGGFSICFGSSSKKVILI